MKKQLPIGYYLKKLDNLLTEGIRRIHEAAGITRLQWQILNTVHTEKGVEKAGLYSVLEEFADEETMDNTIRNLIERELLHEGDRLTLTDQGQTFYANCREKQDEFRRRVMQGVSDEAYLQVISVLEKMIENLEE